MLKTRTTRAAALASVPKDELVEESNSEEEPMEVVDEDAEVDIASKKNKLIMNPNVPNVIYIGHLPRDCEERALTEFLKQFGRLIQLRVCRSHKTGGSKGYAFAKFHNSEVAAIASKSLNGHLLYQKRLVSHVLAPEQNHPKLFSSNAPTKFLEEPKQPGPKSLEKMEETTKRLKQGDAKKRAALKAKGIDYDFPGYGVAGGNSKATENGSEDDTDSVEEEPATKKAKKAATPSASKAGKKKRKQSIDAEEDKKSAPKEVAKSTPAKTAKSTPAKTARSTPAKVAKSTPAKTARSTPAKSAKKEKVKPPQTEKKETKKKDTKRRRSTRT